jgi:UDPglucose 6-dehydrogenase
VPVLGIVGHGVIGKAVSSNARCEVLICDRENPQHSIDFLAENSDIIVIAVGTPRGPGGRCDVSSLNEVLSALKAYKKPIVSHCTAPAAFYAEWFERLPNLVHVPEFVTAARSVEEYGSQSRLIVGGDRKVAEKVFDFWCRNILSYNPSKRPELITCSIGDAAMVKYAANVLLASKVVLVNLITEVCDEYYTDWDTISSILAKDPRLGNSHWQVPGPDGKWGYGGACFPKDMEAFINQAMDVGITPHLLMVIDDVNDSLRNGIIEL